MLPFPIYKVGIILLILTSRAVKTNLDYTLKPLACSLLWARNELLRNNPSFDNLMDRFIEPEESASITIRHDSAKPNTELSKQKKPRVIRLFSYEKLLPYTSHEVSHE